MTLQGSQYSTPLYFDGGSETVTLQGSRVTVYPRGGKVGIQLYTKSGSSYSPVQIDLYYQGQGATTYYNAGSSRTFYKRGDPKGGLYNAGSERTFYKRGNLKYGLHVAGTEQTVKLQGAPATLTTETMTALVTA